MKVTTDESQYGKVSMDLDVVAQYAGQVAMECFGIVGMAGFSARDGLEKLLNRQNLARGIQVRMDHGLLELDFHVIVSYGVNIMTVVDNLIDNVKYKVEEFTGIAVEKINVFVEGVRVID